MAIEISAPVAGIGGGVLAVGGGALAVVGGRQVKAATGASQFATLPKVMPMIDDIQSMLGATSNLLADVQFATRDTNGGLFSRIGAAKQLAVLDETPLLNAARKLNNSSSEVIALAKDDAVRLGAAKIGATSGAIKLVAGGIIAATGALLVANAAFDVK